MKRKHRYVIFKVSDDKSTVLIEKVGERGSDWDEFTASVPKNNSRYVKIIFLMNLTNIYNNRWIIYDLEWEDGGRKLSKLCFIMYSPDENNDNAEKFVIACNKEQIKAKCSETNRDF